MEFETLAHQYGTPLYVYDFEHIKTQFTALKEAFMGRKSLLSYAIKANSNLSILSFLNRLGAGADCVSIGEVRRALKAGIKPYKIIYSGVGKGDEEIAEALGYEILFLNIESEAEFERVEQIAASLNKTARLSIRVNPNIDPKTHPYISTGLQENKFGVSVELAKQLYLKANTSPHLQPVGIHFHIGSQLTDLDPIAESAHKIADLARSLIAARIDLKFFDIGGGLGIVYEQEQTITPYDYAQAILSAMQGLDLTIICEPGRFIVGNAGYFLTRVLYEKRQGDKRFVIVDGAMNDLLRPSLYGAAHAVYAPKREGEPQTLADVVGPVCESGDFLAKKVPLPEMRHGDLLVIKSAGAYGMSMASNYNSRPRSAEVGVYAGRSILVREREEFDAMIAPEVSCLQSWEGVENDAG